MSFSGQTLDGTRGARQGISTGERSAQLGLVGVMYQNLNAVVFTADSPMGAESPPRRFRQAICRASLWLAGVSQRCGAVRRVSERSSAPWPQCRNGGHTRATASGRGSERDVAWLCALGLALPRGPLVRPWPDPCVRGFAVGLHAGPFSGCPHQRRWPRGRSSCQAEFRSLGLPNKCLAGGRW